MVTFSEYKSALKRIRNTKSQFVYDMLLKAIKQYKDEQRKLKR